MIRHSIFLSIAAIALSACANPSAGPTEVRSTGATRNFLVMIEGRNFLFDHEGGPARFGFSATRNISARSVPEAEEIAIRRVRDDPTLNEHLLNSSEDPPRVTVTHATEVKGVAASADPNPGYIFYRDRDSK